MKNTYKKLLLLGFIIISGVSITNAQYSRAQWLVGLGVNVAADAGSGIGQVFNPSTNWNIVPYPSRVSGERYIKNGFSVELATTYSQFGTGKYFEGYLSPGVRNYIAVDANIKYYINELYGNTNGRFDPYILWGYGFGYLSTNDGVLQPGGYPTTNIGGMYNMGIGCNAWITNNIGANLQVVDKWAFRNQLSNNVQFALGVLYRFGGNVPTVGADASQTYNVIDHFKSQVNNTAIVAGIGTNVVVDAGRVFKGLFDLKNNWDWSGIPIRVSCEKYFMHGFSVELSGDFNQYDPGKVENNEVVTSQVNYLSIDLNAEYHLRVLLQKPINWFDPYVAAGYGYTQIQPLSGWTHNLGIGATFWINDAVGINLQSLAKWGYIDGVSNTLQHSITIVYKFKGVDTSEGF
jgi:hypothetical protein